MRQTIKEFKFEFNDNLYKELTKLLTEFRSLKNTRDIFIKVLLKHSSVCP